MLKAATLVALAMHQTAGSGPGFLIKNRECRRGCEATTCATSSAHVSQDGIVSTAGCMSLHEAINAATPWLSWTKQGGCRVSYPGGCARRGIKGGRGQSIIPWGWEGGSKEPEEGWGVGGHGGKGCMSPVLLHRLGYVLTPLLCGG